MFTVEMDDDGGRAIKIVTIDDSGSYEDAEVLIYADEVYISQHDDEYDTSNIIILSPKQWFEILASMSKTEGVYIVDQSK